MNETRPDTIAVLRAIRDHGPLTLRELQGLNIPSVNERASVMNLQTHRYIETETRSINGGSAYAVTPKGGRLLRSLDAGKGNVALARQPVSAERYVGERAIPVRPGSMAAYSLPSIQQGERVERKRPMLIGAAP